MSSELKLSLENFQSISEGELVFHKGLNFIIGQSNSGKSATFRALKACLSNPPSSQRFIKKGTKKASVKLEYNGNQIIWTRTPKESSYTINGEEYVKTGRSDAFKILGDEVGFARDDNDTIMNIEEELQLPFPFGFTKSDLFKLYEDVFCISDSAVILKSAKEQEDAVKSDITQLELDLNKYNIKLSELQKLKDEVDLELLKKNKTHFIQERDRLSALKEGLPIIKRAIVASTVECPEEQSFENLLITYEEKFKVRRIVQDVKRAHKFLKGGIPIQEFVSLLNKYREQEELKKTAFLVSNLEKLGVPNLVVTDFLSDYRDKKEVRRLLSVMRQLDIEVPVETFVNRIIDLQSLNKYKKELKEIISKGKAAQAQYREQLMKIKELRGKLSEYKVCPLCQRPLEGEEEC